MRSFYNRPTGHLHNDVVLLLQQNPSGFYSLVKIRAFFYLNFAGTTKSMKIKGIAMTSSSNRTTKDKQKIWHARHAGDFAGYELLITRT